MHCEVGSRSHRLRRYENYWSRTEAQTQMRSGTRQYSEETRQGVGSCGFEPRCGVATQVQEGPPAEYRVSMASRPSQFPTEARNHISI